MIQKLLTITKAAERIGVSMGTLRKWDKNGFLKAIRFNKNSPRRYRVEIIEEFILKHITI
ncbi:MAG: helix-turn-helix domain-containing protein [Nanoarchaeota archaeon]